MTSPVKNFNIFRDFILYDFNMIFPCQGENFSMLSRFSATGENHTLLLYEIKHTLFFLLVFFAFSESLFAKNHSCTSFNSLLTIWKKVFTVGKHH